MINPTSLDQFYTAEKYLHLIGSIWLHLEVLKKNERSQGGSWEQIITNLELLYHAVVAEFNVKDKEAELYFKLMVMSEITPGNLTAIQAFFPSASCPSDESQTYKYK